VELDFHLRGTAAPARPRALAVLERDEELPRRVEVAVRLVVRVYALEADLFEFVYHVRPIVKYAHLVGRFKAMRYGARLDNKHAVFG